MKQFLVVTAGGVVVHATSDPHEAARVAGQGGTYQWIAPTAEEVAQIERRYRVANPRGKRLPGVKEPAGGWEKAVPPKAGRESISRVVGGDLQRSVKAARLTSLPEVPASVMSMSLEDAYAALRPIFMECHEASIASVRQMFGGRELTKKEYGAAAVAYDFPQLVAPGGAFLSANAKLDKRDPKRAAVALGLNLLPESSPFTLQSEAGVDLRTVPILNVAGKKKTVVGRAALAFPLQLPVPAVPRPAGATFCAGASKECKRSCLVNTGQNASSMRSNYSKYAKARALLERPYEFMRILGEALHRYAESTAKDVGGGDPKVTKFVRLNVLSDIPWEWVAPWVFDMFSGRLRFYDYTKVAGRPFVDNYDLSFSYSGSNTEDCLSEFQRGRRIVQVYAAPGYLRKQEISRIARSTATKEMQALLDITDEQAQALKKSDPRLYARREKAWDRYERISTETWLALNKLPTSDTIGDSSDGLVLPVKDGDITDFRPFDEKGVIVGLRWKHPRVYDESGERGEINWEDMPKRFVLYGDVSDVGVGSAIFKLPETPISADPRNKTEQAVVAIQQARAEALAGATRAKWKVVR